MPWDRGVLNFGRHKKADGGIRMGGQDCFRFAVVLGGHSGTVQGFYWQMHSLVQHPRTARENLRRKKRLHNRAQNRSFNAGMRKNNRQHRAFLRTSWNQSKRKTRTLQSWTQGRCCTTHGRNPEILPKNFDKRINLKQPQTRHYENWTRCTLCKRFGRRTEVFWKIFLCKIGRTLSQQDFRLQVVFSDLWRLSKQIQSGHAPESNDLLLHDRNIFFKTDCKTVPRECNRDVAHWIPETGLQNYQYLPQWKAERLNRGNRKINPDIYRLTKFTSVKTAKAVLSESYVQNLNMAEWFKETGTGLNRKQK